MTAQSLALQYLRARGRSADAATPELAGTLADLLTAGRRAWPNLRVSDEAFVEHLAGLPLQTDDAAALAGLRADDLMLACACRLGDPQALRSFDARFGELMRTSFANPGASGVDADDLQQILRQRLFVGADGKRPKIWDYAGRGSLFGWLKVAALRLRIDSERKVSDKHDPLPESEHGDAPLERLVDDPELQAFKHEYREAFRAAFARALAGLTPRERNLLRQTVVHGLSATEIAKLQGVHRTTTKRWLAEIRDKLLALTREQLMTTLGIGTDEFRSVMQLLQSRLDLSVCRHLDEP